MPHPFLPLLPGDEGDQLGAGRGGGRGLHEGLHEGLRGGRGRLHEWSDFWRGGEKGEGGVGSFQDLKEHQKGVRRASRTL